MGQWKSYLSLSKKTKWVLGCMVTWSFFHFLQLLVFACFLRTLRAFPQLGWATTNDFVLLSGDTILLNQGTVLLLEFFIRFLSLNFRFFWNWGCFRRQFSIFDNALVLFKMLRLIRGWIRQLLFAAVRKRLYCLAVINDSSVCKFHPVSMLNQSMFSCSHSFL